MNRKLKESLYIMALCLHSCLSHPACKLHLFRPALHCHLQPLWAYHIFPRYLTTFRWGEGGGYLKYFFLFSLQPLSEIVLILRII